MKDYKSTLKAFDATVTINATLNRLGEIAIETEDKQLKTMLENIAGRLRALHAKGTEKIRVAGIPQSHPLSGDISKMVAVVTAYCRKCIDSKEPQWQILARQAGWTPPA